MEFDTGSAGLGGWAVMPMMHDLDARGRSTGRSGVRRRRTFTNIYYYLSTSILTTVFVISRETGRDSRLGISRPEPP